MIKKFSQNYKRASVIFLIVAFGIAGIISCSGEDITGSSRGADIESPDNTGPVMPIPEPPFSNDFPTNTYYEIYVPFASAEADGARVSYMDTNSLNSLWKMHISRAGSNDNIKWIIRDGNNRLSNPLEGNYYYFDKNADINYFHQTDNKEYKIKLKEFVGGVIVRTGIDYKGNPHGLYTIGGLYRYLLNREGENSKGEKGYTKYDNSPLNEFMREIHHWGEGDLTVILMNKGYATFDRRYIFNYSYEFGVDEYYCTVDDNYRKKPEYFIGQNPTNYLGVRTNEYWHEKLNVRVNHSHYLDRYNFRFTMAEAYDWWLQ